MDYGIAWKVDSAGNVVFNKDGTLQTVEEEENLAQAVWILLLTVRGEDQWNPEDGIAYYEFIGENYGALSEEILELFLTEGLLLGTEPKIKEVSEIQVNRSGREYTIKATIIGQNGEKKRIITEIGI